MFGQERGEGKIFQLSPSLFSIVRTSSKQTLFGSGKSAERGGEGRRQQEGQVCMKFLKTIGKTCCRYFLFKIWQPKMRGEDERSSRESNLLPLVSKISNLCFGLILKCYCSGVPLSQAKDGMKRTVSAKRERER